MRNAATIKKELRKFADPKRAKSSIWFFKTGKGEYGEGDKFIGLKSADTRAIVKKYFAEANTGDIEELLKSPTHEERLTALLMLVEKNKKANEKEKKDNFDFYLSHTDRINNWDLVDLSAPRIVGDWLIDKNKSILYRLSKSKNQWERRIAVLATFPFIKKGEMNDSLELAKILMNDKEDLMHKAVGWMLREVGKKNEKTLVDFLNEYKLKLPRMTLRYAIERFDEKRRKNFLSK